MQNFSTSPREMIGSAWRNRRLIHTLVKREVVGRYRGSVLGLLWSFFNPLFMLAIYTFVFSVVFKGHWPGSSGSKLEFALILFAGLMIFNMFAECIRRAPALILSNVNYVKKVIFPLEILPCVALGAALFHLAISFGVWVLFYLIFFGIPPATLLLMPLVLLPLLFLTLGLSWFLASLGVFLRDVGQVISLLVMMLMYLSAIMYPITAVPESYRIFIYANPLAMIIDQARMVMWEGQLMNVWLYVSYLAASLVIAALGFAWFQKTRKGFADVL